MAREDYSPVPDVTPTGPRPAYLPAEAGPESFGGLPAAAEQKLGGDLEQAGQQTFQTAVYLQQMKNSTDALDAGTKFSTEIGNLETGFMQLSGNNAVNALPKFQKDVTDLRDNYANGLTSPAARLAFDQDSRSRLDRTLVNAGLHVASEAKTAHVNALKASISNDSSLAVQSALQGQPVDFAKVIGKTGWLADELGADDATKKAMVQKNVGDTMADVVRGQIASGQLAKAHETFKQSLDMKIDGLPLMDGDHMAKIQAELTYADFRADAQAERGAGIIRAGITRSLTNADALQKQGYVAPLPSDNQIDAAFPRDPDRAAYVKDRVGAMRNINTFLPMVATATPQQIQDLELKLKPDPSKPDTFAKQTAIYDGFVTAMRRRNEAIYGDPTTGKPGDPATYLLANDKELQGQWAAAQKDPTAFATYVQSVKGIQTSLGVPDQFQHVLPATTAQGLALKVVTDPTDAQTTLTGLKKQYGGDWDSVWRDMVTEGKLPIAYQAVEDIPDPLQASYLARALSAPKEGGKSLESLVPEDMKKGNTGIGTLVDMGAQSFIHALDGAGASDPMKAEMLDAMKRLAYANVVYGGAPDAATAAQKALSAFTGHYTFLPNGNAMIPTANADAISANMAATLRDLPKAKLQVPAIYGQPGQAKPEEYAGSIQGAPIWKNAASGDAVLLYDPGGRVVRRADGTPISVPFDAPMPAALQAPGFQERTNEMMEGG